MMPLEACGRVSEMEMEMEVEMEGEGRANGGREVQVSVWPGVSANGAFPWWTGLDWTVAVVFGACQGPPAGSCGFATARHEWGLFRPKMAMMRLHVPSITVTMQIPCLVNATNRSSSCAAAWASCTAARSHSQCQAGATRRISGLQ